MEEQLKRMSWQKNAEADGAFQKMSGARFIAETLKGYEVTHVFFVEAILRGALIEMEELGIRRILTHSEKTAAYMADGYARTSRKPGICMAQSVGASNLAAGLQDAFLGLSPVIAITGRRPSIALYRHAYQEIIHGPMFDPVTKYNVSIDNIEQLPYLLRQAFREATSGAPGPVHMDVIGHLGKEICQAEAKLKVLIEEPFSRYPSVRSEPLSGDIEKAAWFLKKAERPVIVAGGGATASWAGPEIVRLAEMLSMPVATSLNGKGAILENHPLSLGVVGSYSRWCANRVVSEADLVIFVGSHTGDQATNNWTLPKTGTQVIQIDIDPLELGRNYPNTVGLVGDAKAGVSKLIDCVKTYSPSDRWAKKAQKLVNKWKEEVQPLRNSDARPIRPERLCKEITDHLPSDAVLVSDTGYAGIWTGSMVYLNHSEQRYIRAAGSLGWAFPASLGAKCAAPNRPVVCFTGDAGFWYHLTELETAYRYGLNTVTVVNNNLGFGQCVPGIEKAYGDRPGKREELYRFQDFSFAKIAEDMGCKGFRVVSADEIGSTLKKALSSDRPTVVEVITDIKCQAPEPWTPSH